MRIHTDTLTQNDIYLAARHARADVVKIETRGSRKRDHVLEVKLEGESRRAPNGGASGRLYASGKAATWDQWGVFLAILFDIDPNAFTPYDANRHAFRVRTAQRFDGDIVGEGVSTNYNVVNGRAAYQATTVHRLGSSYWPTDAHGDHRFQWDGSRIACTKCSAIQR